MEGFVSKRAVTDLEILANKNLAEVGSEKTATAGVDIGLVITDDGASSGKNNQPFLVE